jgi:hypothetical protein
VRDRGRQRLPRAQLSFAGVAEANGEFDTRAFTQTAHLAKGYHTLVMSSYPDHAGSAAVRWSVQFDVYTT